jgi:VanZ family protein
MKKKLTIVFTWTWVLIILVLYLMSGKAIPQFSFSSLFQLDKLVHFTLFFVLSWLLVKSFTIQTSYPSLKVNTISKAFFLSFIYGFTLEFLQYFVPDRNFDVLDIVANTAGTFFPLFFMKKKSSEKKA